MPDKFTVNSCIDKNIVLSKWKVQEGTIVYDGRILFLYEDGEKLLKFKSKYVGTVTKLLAKEGAFINKGDPILELEQGCSHPTVINDLCAECGADLQKDGKVASEATIPMIHSIPTLKVSQQQAQMLGRADTARLLKDRKLVLLVDLDNTLIHTTHDNIPNNLKDVHHFQLFGNPWYHTRLRPGTQQFLEEMSKYFELHICTFGVRPYAHMVAHILDKDAKLFSNRILSRDECLHANSKHANLKALFPCGDELVCIIDDREDVWNFSPNVIPVKPYYFFRSTGDIHTDPRAQPTSAVATDYLAPGVKIKENSKKEEEEGDNIKMADEIEVEEEDDYLIHLSDILKRVHKTFYQVYDKKVEGEAETKWVIDHLRSKTLKGCELAFSGLVPLRTKLEESEPAVLAKRLGATLSEGLTPQVTHLVAAGKGTAKVHQARKMKGLKVVNPHWLLTCAHRWERIEEKLYDISNDFGPLPPQFGRSGAKGVPTSLITLSQEDMDAMAEEVGDLSDSDSEKEEEKQRDDEDEGEQEVDYASDPESKSSNASVLDEEEDLSLLGHQIEQGLSDEG